MLSDAQWDAIADLLPARTGRRGRPFSDARPMIEGIVYRYRYRCGIAWRDVPGVFGRWQAIWTWRRRLAGDGTWDRVLERLLTVADAVGAIDWAVSVDSTIVRAHQHATNTARHTGGTVELHESAYRAARPCCRPLPGRPVDENPPARRRTRTTDGGLVAPGRSGDSPAFPHLLDHLRVPRLAG